MSRTRLVPDKNSILDVQRACVFTQALDLFGAPETMALVTRTRSFSSRKGAILGIDVRDRRESVAVNLDDDPAHVMQQSEFAPGALHGLISA